MGVTYEARTTENDIKTAGTAEQVRERVEELLIDVLDFFVMLEHRDEEVDEEGNPQYILFLHTDNEDDLSEEQISKLKDLGLVIGADEEENHQVICQILGLSGIH